MASNEDEARSICDNVALERWTGVTSVLVAGGRTGLAHTGHSKSHLLPWPSLTPEFTPLRQECPTWAARLRRAPS